MVTADRTEIEKRLTPAPSMSRTGKMTHSAMHTDALVRGGVAALQSKARRSGKASITLAEIIDPSQLDSFGTALPGLDAGRGKELCSSPRGHPDLQNKLAELLVTERTNTFRQKMELKGEKELLRLAAAEEAAAAAAAAAAAGAADAKGASPPTAAAAARLAKSAGERRPARAKQQSSACFMTPARFFESKYAVKPPPVGHYRPKFSAVDGNMKSAVMRAPAKQSPNSTMQSSQGLSDTQTSCARLLRVEMSSQERDRVKRDAAKHQQQMQQTHDSQKDGAPDASGDATEAKPSGGIKPSPPGGSPGAAGAAGAAPAAEDERSPPRCQGYAEWVARRRAGAPPRGTSMFVSSVKIAAHRSMPPPTSPDKFYYPYNEPGRCREVSNVSLDWTKHTSRSNRIMFKGHSDCTDAPDVMYMREDTSARSTAGTHSFADQVTREKAAADAQQMVSRRTCCINAAAKGDTQRFPASHVTYNTSGEEHFKYKANRTMVDFIRTTGRDQRPTEVQRPKVPLDPVLPYDTTAASPSKTDSHVLFQNQLDRPKFLGRLPNDLQYCVRDPAAKKNLSADIDRTEGHKGLFVPSITMDCDYEPNYAAVRPLPQRCVHLDKALSRDEVRSGHSRDPKDTLDTFYRTEAAVKMRMGGLVVSVPLQGSRVTGNPMIHSHVSREKRAHATAVKSSSPDKFYNPQSPQAKVASIDFKRVVARADRSCGRMLPASPRQQESNVRSPGFVYEPKLVEKHSPALTFSRSGL